METNLYIVQPGDSLWKIARRFGTTVEELARFNGLEDPGHLVPGQAVRLPRTGETEIPIYIVQPGDSLWKIARRLGTTVEELTKLNQLTDPEDLRPGQVLRMTGEDQRDCFVLGENETLGDAARRLGTTAAALMNENAISDPDSLPAGTRLFSPTLKG